MDHKFIDKSSDKTLVLLHGTGGDENSLLPIARTVAPKMNHLSLRGNVVDNGMRRFAKVSTSTGLLDEQDMLERVPDIITEIHRLKEHYRLKELWALGFSNGANAIAALLLDGDPGFTKAILLRPMDLAITTKETDLNHMRVLIHSGRYDDIIPFEKAVALEKRLRANHGDVQHNIYDLDHRMNQSELSELRAWFDKELNP